MNEQWFTFDVREEVLKDVKRFCLEQGITLPEGMSLGSISTSTLMDSAFLESFLDAETVAYLKVYVQERYFYFRGRKYGNQAYWQAAKAERDIGYGGHWYDYIETLLSRYNHEGAKVLFVGTANGVEIPAGTRFQYYALEQLEASAEQIKTVKQGIVKVTIGSFEDETLFIDQPQSISCIVALRCLTPNCRLDRFSSFVENNLSDHGTLILSYPTSYIAESGALVPLLGINDQLRAFEQKLHEELVEKCGMHMRSSLCSDVEKIYILSPLADA